MTLEQQIEKLGASQMLINAAKYVRDRCLGEEAYQILRQTAWDLFDEVEGYSRSLVIN